jgi:hypothetical protein
VVLKEKELMEILKARISTSYIPDRTPVNSYKKMLRTASLLIPKWGIYNIPALFKPSPKSTVNLHL